MPILQLQTAMNPVFLPNITTALALTFRQGCSGFSNRIFRNKRFQTYFPTNIGYSFSRIYPHHHLVFTIVITMKKTKETLYIHVLKPTAAELPRAENRKLSHILCSTASRQKWLKAILPKQILNCSGSRLAEATILWLIPSVSAIFQ